MQKTMADIEVKKFAEMVSAIGRDTLAAISRAGPETQVTQLLMGLSARNSVFGRKSFFGGVREQQRHRPVCASAQSDQHLCCFLNGKYHI